VTLDVLLVLLDVSRLRYGAISMRCITTDSVAVVVAAAADT
jgi:hypothetical protein